MSKNKKIGLTVAVILIGAFCWFTYGIYHTWKRIPEAYAAWDTGTLLVEYMRQNDDRWPQSWEDLGTVLNHPEKTDFLIYGSYEDLPSSDQEHAQGRRLSEMVTIDWSFDPEHPDNQNPVTTHEGKPFPVLWQGKNPNGMIRGYLSTRK